MILHVVDVSDPQMDLHMYVVYDTLRELGITDKPVITVFNKMDLVAEDVVCRDSQADAVFRISAVSGQGVDKLKEGIVQMLRSRSIFVEKLFPYEKVGKIQLIRQFGQLLTEEYTEDGVWVTGYIPDRLFGQLYE